ncbi:MAG: o-succinylbenzoate synthase [bacterium]|nr:o-succinylbenzoate synthase [bacterium]
MVSDGNAPIERISLREIVLPLREPFATSHGTMVDRRLLLLHLRDGDGCKAFSECVALPDPGYSHETTGTAAEAIREEIAPRVLGRRFDGADDLHELLSPAFPDQPMARAAVEMGAWGLAAERRGISLARLLGGERARIEAGVALGIQPDIETLVAKVRGAVDAGYRRIKFKIRPGDDLEPLTAARETVGDGFQISADANSAYTLDDADELAALDDVGLTMIEQPLGHDDLEGHAALQRRIATPICLDETITGRDRAEQMLAARAGRIVNLKPGRVGGLTEALAIHRLCHDRNVPLWCGGMLESGVGRAYNVALASLPGFTLPGDLSPSARYWHRDVAAPEWTMDEQGTVAVPFDTPGIGVEVDRDRIDDLTVSRQILT